MRSDDFGQLVYMSQQSGKGGTACLAALSEITRLRALVAETENCFVESQRQNSNLMIETDRLRTLVAQLQKRELADNISRAVATEAKRLGL